MEYTEIIISPVSRKACILIYYVEGKYFRIAARLYDNIIMPSME